MVQEPERERLLRGHLDATMAQRFVFMTAVSDNKFKSSASKTHKIEPPKIHRCVQEGCDKVFFDSASLKKHMSTHGERLFICPVKGCGKKFLDNSKLRRHHVVHTVRRVNKPGGTAFQV